MNIISVKLLREGYTVINKRKMIKRVEIFSSSRSLYIYTQFTIFNIGEDQVVKNRKRNY